MPRLTAALAVATLACAAPVAAELEVYGFIRFDAILDDSRLSHPQFPSWVNSEDPTVGAEDDAHLSLHPRLTRIGLRSSAVDVGDGATLEVRMEADFQNGGRESREILRMRHAWFRLAKGSWSLLGGQTWALISPLYPAANNDGMMWHAGNLGDRHPQARLTYAAGGGLSVAVAAGQTGAVDGQDLDSNGRLDGGDSGLPFLQTRIGLEHARANIGIWGHWASETTSVDIGGEDSFTSTAVGVDAAIPLTASLRLEGEGWTGSNLSDMRGGIGQGVNTATGEEVASTGGWAQLAVSPGPAWKLFFGATLDSPDEDDLGAGARTKNQAFFAVARYRTHERLQVALEYLNWTTEYAGLQDGTANRLNLHLTCRL